MQPRANYQACPSWRCCLSEDLGLFTRCGTRILHTCYASRNLQQELSPFPALSCSIHPGYSLRGRSLSISHYIGIFRHVVAIPLATLSIPCGTNPELHNPHYPHTKFFCHHNMSVSCLQLTPDDSVVIYTINLVTFLLYFRSS